MQQPVPQDAQGVVPQESHDGTGAAQEGVEAQAQSSMGAALIEAADDDASNIAKAESRRMRKLRRLEQLLRELWGGTGMQPLEGEIGRIHRLICCDSDLRSFRRDKFANVQVLSTFMVPVLCPVLALQ